MALALKAPENVYSIGDKAFQDCGDLELVLFNDNLRELGSNAFENVTKLGSVTLPPLENIGAQVFTMSDDFTDISFTGDRPIFKGVPANEVKDVTAVLTAWYPAAWGDKDPTVWKFDATIRWQAY